MNIEEEYNKLMKERGKISLEKAKKENKFQNKLEKIENKFKKKYGININEEVNWFNIIKVIEQVIKDVNRENESERTL